MKEKQLKVPEAFYSLFAVGRIMGIPKNTIASFDKENPNAVSELSPIAHLFICFEEEGRKAWAIRKRYFEKWRKTGIVTKINSGRPKDNRDTIQPNPRLNKVGYEEFKQCVDLINQNSLIRYTYEKMIDLALKEFVDRRVVRK